MDTTDSGVSMPQPDWIDLDRVSLRYVLDRRPLAVGPPVILLHEMGGTLESWDNVFPLVARHHTVLIYDWRGAGHSERITGNITLADHVADLAALLDRLDPGGPAIIVGCAVGAAIAAGFAAACPDRVAGLVLLSPAFGIAPELRVSRHARVDAFVRDGMRGAVDQSLADGYPERFRQGSEDRFASFRARWLANDPESFAATFRMLIDLNIEPVLAALSCPVLAVGGEHDPVRTPDYVRRLADRIPGAHFVQVPGGHHMAHQIPEIIAQLVTRFAADPLRYGKGEHAA